MSEAASEVGRISSVGIPAVDVPALTAFSQSVFGWNVRQRGDGATACDDGAGHVSATWTINRTQAADPGVRLHVPVEAEAGAAGGTFEAPPDMSVVDRGSPVHAGGR